MAIQFGPKLPKGTEPRSPFTKGKLVQGQEESLKSNTLINNESKPGAGYEVKDFKNDRSELKNPGDFCVWCDVNENGKGRILYVDRNGEKQWKEFESKKEVLEIYREYHDKPYFGE